MKPPHTTAPRSDLDERGGLADHLQLCMASLGPGFRMRCVADTIHSIVMPRVITTLFVSSLILLSALLVL